MSNLPTLKWGIIGAGQISGCFVSDLILDRPDARALHDIIVVGSRSLSKSQGFIAEHLSNSQTRAAGSYESVFEDEEVSAVYVGTIHTTHKELVLAAIAAGKHVLCEKPMALNRGDAERMIGAAREAGVFLMEAVWTRFFPIARELRRVVHEDLEIGEVHRCFADFGIAGFAEVEASHRVKDIRLGGGALLDIGVYSVTWARMAMDGGVGEKAQEMRTVGSQVIDEKEGVDYTTSAIITFPKTKGQAIISSTFWGAGTREILRVEGQAGVVRVFGKYASCPTRMVVSLNGKAEEEERVYEPEKVGFGYYWEADAVAEDIAAGRRENEIMPLQETVNVMEIMDTIRQQNGLVYPQERA